MRFIFSQREKARKAAIQADQMYANKVPHMAAMDNVVPERWSYVINAALSALDDTTEAAVVAEKERVLAEVERLRTVLDSEESALRQLSEWLRGKESGT